MISWTSNRSSIQKFVLVNEHHYTTHAGTTTTLVQEGYFYAMQLLEVVVVCNHKYALCIPFPTRCTFCSSGSGDKSALGSQCVNNEIQYCITVNYEWKIRVEK